MNKKGFMCIIGVVLLVTCSFIFDKFDKKNLNSGEMQKLQATVLEVENSNCTVMDTSHGIYTFKNESSNCRVGDNVVIEYTGILDKNRKKQYGKITSYKTITVATNEDGIPNNYLDDGIFSQYYVMAYNKLKELSLEEKIGQLLLVRHSDDASSIIKNYKVSGFVFFEKDFKNKTEKQVKDMIGNLQSKSTIPLLTAVDEEGGSVVRVSSNPNLAPSKFKSPQELYNSGGFDAIKNDTLEKSRILYNLGLNLNLAPVVDVSTNPDDYMYDRTLGESVELTKMYAKTVIEASKKGKVSYTLKHFPGYGNNIDTHTSSSVDTRSYDDILNNDLPPFEEGIKAQAEAILVSHNIVNSIDATNPASLSSNVHNLLRNELGFTGVIITDDLAMSAVSSIYNVAVKAVLAGNDLLITTDYETSFKSIKKAVDENVISEELIDQLAFKVLAWKYYKGLMVNVK